MAGLTVHCVRLHPGQDLVSSMLAAAQHASFLASAAAGRSSSSGAVFVITCVGSLDQVELRLATILPTGAAAAAPCTSTTSTSTTNSSNEATTNNNNNNIRANTNRTWQCEEPVEIVSLVGTFASSSSSSAAADSTTTITKKHLHMSVSDAQGSVWGGHLIRGRVFTTVELVLGTAPNQTFVRTFDAETGYEELEILPADNIGKEQNEQSE